MPFMG